MRLIGQRCYNGVRLLGQGPCPTNVNRLDMGAVPMLSHYTRRGMQIDPDHFIRLEKQLLADMDRVTEEVKDLTGYYVNLDSGDQVADLLFKKMGLKQARIKFTKSGSRESVEDEVLVAIQHEHPVVPLIQDFKEYSKLKGTYTVPIPKLARRTRFGEWRLFPNLGHTRVPSGRLNCKEPNLLAMPNRTERGREIRKGFTTQEGWRILSVDESQIEVRVAAHCSKDPNLIRVYENEEDIYSDFATSSFSLEDKRYRATGEEAEKLRKKDKPLWVYPTVDPRDHRFPAKTCVLASIYDVTAPGLLEQMPVICSNCGKPSSKHDCDAFTTLWNETNCQEQINAFYLKYPGVMRDRKRYHKMVMEYGYLWDIWGRILHCAAGYSVLEWVKNQALREVSNEPYQGGAQGTIKLVMAEVYDTLVNTKMFDVVHPILQVHDELLFEVREDMVEEIGAYVSDRFENCVRLEVPIKASKADAVSWGDIDK